MNRLVVLGVMAALAGSLAAQDRTVVPPVDQAKGQTLVDTLTKENESLKSELADLDRQKATLRANVAQAQKALTDLSPLVEDVRQTSVTLARVSEPVVDRQLSRQAQASADAVLVQLKRLQARQRALQDAVSQWTQTLEQVEAQRETDLIRMERNSDDILVIRASLSRTQQQADELQALDNQIAEATTRVDAALAQSDALVSSNGVTPGPSTGSAPTPRQ